MNKTTSHFMECLYHPWQNNVSDSLQVKVHFNTLQNALATSKTQMTSLLIVTSSRGIGQVLYLAYALFWPPSGMSDAEMNRSTPGMA